MMPFFCRPCSVFLTIFLSFSLIGCGKSSDSTTNAINISVITPIIKNVEITQQVVGSLDTIEAPIVAAEAAGRVLEILADEGQPVTENQVLAKIDPIPLQLGLQAAQADQDRLQALTTNQTLTVGRYQELLKLKSVSQSMADEANAQLKSLQSQLLAAQVNVESHKVQLSKADVRAPVAGYVQKKMISVGDFANIGTPTFKLVTLNKLRAYFSFPETIADQLRIGERVILTSPVTPNVKVTASVTEIIPMLTASNRAINVLVDFENPGTWRPGSSINGNILFTTINQARLVPEQSIVNRKEGTVIFAITKDGHAKAIPVEVGEYQDGMVEIKNKIPAKALIANQGAGYLEDGAKVNIVSQAKAEKK